MIEVHPGLWIGSEADYERRVRHEQNWRVVHACRDPYHRAALGYTGRGAPKTHPEYLVARRGHRLILNLIDSPDPAYIRRELMDTAVAFVGDALQSGTRVIVHCNQGRSRGPTIGLLAMLAHTDALPADSLEGVVGAFRRLYPGYEPGAGMSAYLRANWRRHATAHAARTIE